MTTRYIPITPLNIHSEIRIDTHGDEASVTVYNCDINHLDLLIMQLEALKAEHSKEEAERNLVAYQANPMTWPKDKLFPELAVNMGAASLIDADEPPQKSVDRSEPTTHYTCAETATFIREALKKAFPGQKFSVRSKVYSGGASINISWMDGVTEYEVNQVVQRFSGATFDGMIDLKSNVYYNDENGSNVSYGADYVFCNRHYSNGLTSQLAAQVANFEGIDTPEMNAWDWYDYSIQLRDGQLFTTRLSEARYCYSAIAQKYIGDRFGHVPQWIECMIG